MPNDSGPSSACFGDDPKSVNCETAQPKICLAETPPKMGQHQRGGRFKGLNDMYFLGRPGPREPFNIGRKCGARAPQISSDCPMETLVFELGVGDRLGTLRVFWNGSTGLPASPGGGPGDPNSVENLKSLTFYPPAPVGPCRPF